MAGRPGRSGGHNRLTLAQHALRGTTRRGRHLRQAAAGIPRPAFPAATADDDDPPAVLAADPVAAAEWRRLVPLLRAAGILTKLDLNVVIALCIEWSKYVAAQQQPMTAAVGNRALRQCRALWTELGLTPSSRAKLTAPPVGSDGARASKWGDALPPDSV